MLLGLICAMKASNPGSDSVIILTYCQVGCWDGCGGKDKGVRADAAAYLFQSIEQKEFKEQQSSLVMGRKTGGGTRWWSEVWGHQGGGQSYRGGEGDE